MGKIIVKLRRGHPKRVMLARLSDGAVVSVDEAGLEIEPGLVSDEMRASGWFEVEGVQEGAENLTQRREGTKEKQEQEVQKPEADPETETDPEPESDPEPEPEPEVVLTPAQKAAATRAANKAARAKGE